VDVDIERVREAFLAADFTLAGVTDRLGEAALAGLARNSSFPARDALGDAADSQARLIRAFILGEQADVAEAARPLLGLEVKPYGWGERSGWIVSDPTPLDGLVAAPRDDFVLGASPASTTLAQMTVRKPAARALDLGTGCGIQVLHLLDHCAEVVATDINPRALALAELTIGLSAEPARASLLLGDLYEPAAGDFDLIAANPPFVMAPPQSSHLVYREGGFAGDGLMRAVVERGAARLREGGMLQVLGNWAIHGGDWRDELAQWIPSGCDALILRRETLDPYAYIELWLADAGTPFGPDYSQWKAYFDSLGIRGVGMGWINLRRADAANPKIRIEDWPHPVAQPVGADIAAFFDAPVLDDAALLARRWTLAADAAQEQYGRPGEADPEHVVLRRRSGLCRFREVTGALAAVAGACDGELPLGDLIGGAAAVLGSDSAALTAQLLPGIRDLVDDGFLA
jgi:hypothetical protein